MALSSEWRGKFVPATKGDCNVRRRCAGLPPQPKNWSWMSQSQKVLVGGTTILRPLLIPIKLPGNHHSWYLDPPKYGIIVGFPKILHDYQQKIIEIHLRYTKKPSEKPMEIVIHPIHLHHPGGSHRFSLAASCSASIARSVAIECSAPPGATANEESLAQGSVENQHEISMKSAWKSAWNPP